MWVRLTLFLKKQAKIFYYGLFEVDKPPSFLFFDELSLFHISFQAKNNALITKYAYPGRLSATFFSLDQLVLLSPPNPKILYANFNWPFVLVVYPGVESKTWNKYRFTGSLTSIFLSGISSSSMRLCVSYVKTRFNNYKRWPLITAKVQRKLSISAQISVLQERFTRKGIL